MRARRRTSYVCFAIASTLAFVTLLLVYADTAHAEPQANRAVAWGSGANPKTACVITDAHVAPAGTGATFTVSGECELTLVSYEKHGKGTLGEQTLYDSTTEEFSCVNPPNDSAQPSSARTGSGSSSVSSAQTSSGSSCAADLTVKVPDCRWQVDLVLGQPRIPPTSYPSGAVLTWIFGGEGICHTPTTTTLPTTTTSTSTTTTPISSTTSTTTIPSSGPSTTNTVISSTTRTPLGGSAELPHTGGGELLPVALSALGVIGAGRLVEWRGRRRRARL